MGEAVAEVGSTANKYEILARLATGGMAEIFLARGVSATGVERYCVLKRILRNRASDVSFVRMFLDEARLAAQLQHPNVAQVYDIGKLGDSYFFTMEYVHGETVRAIMQRARSLRRDLPVAVVLTIIAGAAAGLHHAHDRIGIDGRPLNIVHRDVSPSNLMVSYEGSVKVVDFGVAKASDRANETRSGTVKGKISYLSPEQARGSSSIDRRSDMFSLGIVLWELLTTERLYKRASDFENMSAIVTEPPPAPSSRKSWVPPELDAIALRLLAKSPDERFQNADELIAALEEFATRNQTMISASTLSRFLREMFGQRPEPWVEMDTVDAAEGVTVTSEPIPGELAIPIDANVDLQLGSVPKLDLEQPLAQIEDELVMPAEDHIPTRPHPKIDPAGGMTLIGQGIGGSGPQPRIPPSGPQPFIAPVAYPRAAPTDRLPEDDEPSKGVGWQLVGIIMIAAIVGSLTMWLVMRNRGDSEVPRDAAVAIVEPPPVVVDAAEPVAVAIDAAEAIVVDAAPPPEPAKPPAAKLEPKKKKSEIEAAWEAGNYRDIVTRCAKVFPTNADDVRCVVAACKVHSESKARNFLAKVDKAKRRSVVSACKNADVDIDLDETPKPPDKPKDKNECELDPMSCQH